MKKLKEKIILEVSAMEKATSLQKYGF